MSQEFEYDVFLSHNCRDKPRVREIAGQLRDRGLRVWFDEWILKAGDDIYLQIEHGLEQSRVLASGFFPGGLVLVASGQSIGHSDSAIYSP